MGGVERKVGLEEDLIEEEDEEVFSHGEEADLRGTTPIRWGSVRGVFEGGLGAVFGGGFGVIFSGGRGGATNRGAGGTFAGLTALTFPGLTLTGLTFTGLTFTCLEALTFTGFEALVLKGLEGPRPTLRPGMAGWVEGRWEIEKREGLYINLSWGGGR